MPADPLRKLDAALRQDFVSFLAKVFETVTGGTGISRNWHHEAIAHELQRLSEGDINRLIVTMPPRQLKSIMISVA